MGQDLQGIIDFFRAGQHTTFWDYFSVFLLLALLVVAILLAAHEFRVRSRARRLKKYKDWNRPRYLQTSRRRHPRLPVRIQVTLKHEDDDDEAEEVYRGELLDISAGGARILLFDTQEPPPEGSVLLLDGKHALFTVLGETKCEIVNVTSSEDVPLLNSKWIDLEPAKARHLSREIRKRLLKQD